MNHGGAKQTGTEKAVVNGTAGTSIGGNSP